MGYPHASSHAIETEASPRADWRDRLPGDIAWATFVGAAIYSLMWVLDPAWTPRPSSSLPTLYEIATITGMAAALGLAHTLTYPAQSEEPGGLGLVATLAAGFLWALGLATVPSYGCFESYSGHPWIAYPALYSAPVLLLAGFGLLTEALRRRWPTPSGEALLRPVVPALLTTLALGAAQALCGGLLDITSLLNAAILGATSGLILLLSPSGR